MSDSNNNLWYIHQRYMLKSLQLAEKAYEEGEIPVGAIVVLNNQIIGKGYNQVEKLKDPTAHAEMIALSAACDTIGNKYLKDATLYVTLEPCPMCAGALVWSKIDKVVYGASDPKAGACGSVLNILNNSDFNHRPEIIQGILEQDSEFLLKSFFSSKRE